MKIDKCLNINVSIRQWGSIRIHTICISIHDMWSYKDGKLGKLFPLTPLVTRIQGLMAHLRYVWCQIRQRRGQEDAEMTQITWSLSLQFSLIMASFETETEIMSQRNWVKRGREQDAQSKRLRRDLFSASCSLSHVIWVISDSSWPLGLDWLRDVTWETNFLWASLKPTSASKRLQRGWEETNSASLWPYLASKRQF